MASTGLTHGARSAQWRKHCVDATDDDRPASLPRTAPSAHACHVGAQAPHTKNKNCTALGPPSTLVRCEEGPSEQQLWGLASVDCPVE
eukprot:GDKH01000843.1.p2 GENE.GDKH01000843.1~~GDKH01000843.1.p2  ORF type:complete len:88 (+),score=2.97 GDKH01000843.1:106-369(+)